MWGVNYTAACSFLWIVANLSQIAISGMCRLGWMPSAVIILQDVLKEQLVIFKDWRSTYICTQWSTGLQKLPTLQSNSVSQKSSKYNASQPYLQSLQLQRSAVAFSEDSMHL
jgi:hypothetical protein